MKFSIKYKTAFCLITTSLLTYSCKDILDITPPSSIIPEVYLNDESQLSAYALTRYSNLPNSDGAIPYDDGTDNAAGMGYSSLFTDGDYKVGEGGGSWDFSGIYQINYFLSDVLPKYKAGKIQGDKSLIDHAIGEMYFFRALEYYNRLVLLGDFPIVKTTLKDDLPALIEKSKRAPRSEVARFIISDLDSAFFYMKEVAPDGKKNRMSKPIAQLMKSRVALFEATWLKNFKGTAFVPNGEGWPGATKDYNKNYQYPSGNIDSEIKWLLGQAMESADYVASRFQLVNNNGVISQDNGQANPYVDMFGADDMSSYNEILLWRDFDKGLGVQHNRLVNGGTSNQGVGITRGYVQSFVMKDGLPYYASNLYKGDNHHSKIMENRDDRIRLFLKIGGQRIIWNNIGQGTHGVPVEPLLPNIIDGSPMFRYNTGFTSRKYSTIGDHARYNNGQGDTGIPIFRAAEAYLNYIEASYELNNSIDGKADQYWRAIRQRANIDPDYNKTVQATNIAKEAELDWAAYSAGKMLSDKILYNIRRERRNEFLYEGFRLNDLRRWRSMDQLMTKKYHIEGFKLWNSDYSQKYIDAKYNFVYDGSSNANVSAPNKSDYLRPYEIMSTNRAFEGYGWHMAHYLNPIAIQHFNITSTNGGEYGDSPVYQNPYWPVVAGQPAIQ